MKQKLILFTILMIVLAMQRVAVAYDFSAVAPSGQTLYFNIVGGNAQVAYPLYSYGNYYAGHTKPTGNLTIPSSVSYGGNTYSVTSIGNSAFHSCSDLTSVTIPNSVTSINNNAFRGCTGLTSVTIPNSVTFINYDAFYGCSGLTSVTIPNSVTSIEDYAFYGCSGLTSVTIPNSVTSIDDHAFYGCSSLTSVTIPSSVTSIENSAFSGCSGLSTVYFFADSCIQAGYFNNPVFGSCTNLSAFYFGNNVKNIPSYLCSGITGLTSVTIPSDVASIGDGAFYNCTGLTTVYFFADSCIQARTYDYYSETAFSNCSNLSSFYFGNNVKIIPDYLCSGLTGLTSITIPDSVTYIGDRAFSGCSSLTSVIIPSSVTSIGNGAFYGCISLTTVNFNADSCIRAGYDNSPVFGYCPNISAFYFGNNVKIIPDYLCYDLAGLTSVTIPNSVTSIGYRAFSDCSSLTSVTIPNSVTSIEGIAFAECTGLTTVYFNADSCTRARYIGGSPIFRNCTNLTSFHIGNNVKIIPDYLCSGIIGLTSVIIPDSVTSIGDGAFYDCTGLTTVYFFADSCIRAGGNNVASAFSNCSNLTAFYFGNNVKIIPSYLCRGLTGLTSITIPNTVSSIGDGAFFGCSGLTSFTIPNYVTTIGDAAFTYCTGLTSVAIPNSVGTIGDAAFSYCTGLTSISIPNSVTAIGNGTFSNCAGLTSVSIPNSVTFIGDRAFSFCRGLTSVAIPNSVGTIGDAAFSYCTGLTSISIPNSVTAIGGGAFSRCTGLTSVIINSPAASSIGKGAFEECGNLATVILSADTIHEDAFKNCDHLTNITFGSDLAAIENNAFDGCTQVVRIVSKATNPPVVQSSTFSSLSDDVILNVPCDATNAYQNAAYWFRFNIQEDLVYDFSATSSNPARGTVTIVTEPTCDYREAQVQANAYHGYHFDHWNDGNTDNPRYIVVMQDTTIIAYFYSDNGEDEGIEETAEEGVKLYQRNGQIVVEGAEGSRVRVYDVFGRVLATKRDDGGLLRFDAPAVGVYLVRVGDAPARKVVVVR